MSKVPKPTKRMQVVVDEITTGPCPECKVHSGLEARIDAICAKLDEKVRRLTERMDDRDQMAQTRNDSLKEAISVAKEGMDFRLQTMNNLTHQLDQQREDTKDKIGELMMTFMPKDSFDLQHKALIDKLDSKIEQFSKEIANLESRQATRKEGMRWMEYLVTIIVSFIVFAFAHFLFKF
jgi:DNA repair exonuclease SbcCD ATPase subunit